MLGSAVFAFVEEALGLAERGDVDGAADDHVRDRLAGVGVAGEARAFDVRALADAWE